MLVVTISALAIACLMAAGFVVYRRKIEAMKPDTDSRAISGARVTAERLRGLSSPPWRVVYEVGSGTLGEVDHVVVGSMGAIAIETVFADRPTEHPSSGEAERIALGAVLRGSVSDLTDLVGVPCELAVRIYWGSPQPDSPAAIEIAPGFVAVDGQRLVPWLQSLPDGALSPAQVDLGWQAVTTGIGRPDPLG